MHELLALRLASAAGILVLDLSQLAFIGVPGLGLLSHIQQRATRRGMQLRLVAALPAGRGSRPG